MSDKLKCNERADSKETAPVHFVTRLGPLVKIRPDHLRISEVSGSRIFMKLNDESKRVDERESRKPDFRRIRRLAADEEAVLDHLKKLPALFAGRELYHSVSAKERWHSSGRFGLQSDSGVGGTSIYS